MNDRLTVKTSLSDVQYSLKAMCAFGSGENVTSELACYDVCNNICYECVIQQAFDRLAEYENTGLSPDEIRELQKERGAIT